MDFVTMLLGLAFVSNSSPGEINHTIGSVVMGTALASVLRRLSTPEPVLMPQGAPNPVAPTGSARVEL